MFWAANSRRYLISNSLSYPFFVQVILMKHFLGREDDGKAFLAQFPHSPNTFSTIITFIKKSEYIYVKPSRSCLVTSLRCRVAKINVWVLLYYQKDYRKSVTYFYCISLILKMKIMPSPLCFLKRALAQFNAVYGVVPTNKNGVCTSY